MAQYKASMLLCLYIKDGKAPPQQCGGFAEGACRVTHKLQEGGETRGGRWGGGGGGGGGGGSESRRRI